MFKSLGFFALTLLLTGCGGGSGGGSSDGGPTGFAPTLSVDGTQVTTQPVVVTVDENTTSVASITSSGGTLSLSTAGDGALFALSGGTLSFIEAPDFEAPAGDGTNTYNVRVDATGASLSSAVTLSVQVQDVVEGIALDGRVVDGPVRDADVFVDLNCNKAADDDEPTGKTDATGFFSIILTAEQQTLIPEDCSPTYIASGGVDVATGKASTIVLQADVPADSTKRVQISPLTTVIAQATTPEAKQAVVESLGITGKTVDEILTEDSWAEAEASEATAEAAAVEAEAQAVAEGKTPEEAAQASAAAKAASKAKSESVQRVNSQLATLIKVASSVASTAQTGASTTTSINLAVEAVAKSIVTKSVTASAEAAATGVAVKVDLTDAAIVEEVIEETVTEVVVAEAVAIAVQAAEAAGGTVEEVAAAVEAATVTAQVEGKAAAVSKVAQVKSVTQAAAAAVQTVNSAAADVSVNPATTQGIAIARAAETKVVENVTKTVTEVKAAIVVAVAAAEEQGLTAAEAEASVAAAAATASVLAVEENVVTVAEIFTEIEAVVEAIKEDDEVIVFNDFDEDGISDLVDNDDDNDGVNDGKDAFPRNASETRDTDGDGVGDNADLDDDGDGVLDTADAFPFNANESVDTDEDTIGNNADTDDDNDGQLDVNELACESNPLDAASLATDTDGDTLPNCVDADIDGDGFANDDDAFPLDDTESVDTDGDDIGDNADTDDDGDGVPDVADIDPLDPTVGGDGFDVQRIAMIDFINGDAEVAYGLAPSVASGLLSVALVNPLDASNLNEMLDGDDDLGESPQLAFLIDKIPKAGDEGTLTIDIDLVDGDDAIRATGERQIDTAIKAAWVSDGQNITLTIVDQSAVVNLTDVDGTGIESTVSNVRDRSITFTSMSDTQTQIEGFLPGGGTLGVRYMDFVAAAVDSIGNLEGFFTDGNYHMSVAINQDGLSNLFFKGQGFSAIEGVMAVKDIDPANVSGKLAIGDMMMVDPAAGGVVTAPVCLESTEASIEYSGSLKALDDFETGYTAAVDAEDGATMGGDWLVGANVFSADGASFLYNYFAFPAGNGGANFTAIGSNDDGKFLNVYSDYNNADHTNGSGNRIEAKVFRELTLDGSETGSYTFSFTAQAVGEFAISGDSTAYAFIAALDPANNYATVLDAKVDMTDVGEGVMRYSVSGDVGAIAAAGVLLQYGFANVSSNADPTGIYYDDLSFSVETDIPGECVEFEDEGDLPEGVYDLYTVVQGTSIDFEMIQSSLDLDNLNGLLNGDVAVSMSPVIVFELDTVLAATSGAQSSSMMLTLVEGSDKTMDAGERSISVEVGFAWESDGEMMTFSVPNEGAVVTLVESDGSAIEATFENLDANLLSVMQSADGFGASLEVRLGSFFVNGLSGGTIDLTDFFTAGDYYVDLMIEDFDELFFDGLPVDSAQGIIVVE